MLNHDEGQIAPHPVSPEHTSILTGEHLRQQRREEIIALFLSGKTTGEIAALYQVSRQNIHAMLKNAGVDIKRGGRVVKAASRKRDQELARDEACARKYQCTHQEWKQLLAMTPQNGETPVAAFNQGRAYARRSGIAWTLGLMDWWTIWVQSGKWSQRGKRRGDYCMMRIDQAAGYEKDNVRIGSNQEHWASVHRQKSARPLP